MFYIDFISISRFLRYWEIVIYYYLILAKFNAMKIAIGNHEAYIAQLNHRFIAKMFLCL
jgi:hypothetical protein